MRPTVISGRFRCF
jgi:hypothetical protein